MIAKDNLRVNENRTIIVTGGAGYIGSHMVVELLQRRYKTVVLDNLCNSSFESIRRIEKLTNSTVYFHKIDLRDLGAVERIFEQYRETIYGVIHFAGLKAVGESTEQPLKYYENNITSTINLLLAMSKSCPGAQARLIFSSSATVYGDPRIIPMDEECKTNPASPYGQSKLISEQIIADGIRSFGGRAVMLRYFNPVGAHPSGWIGEDPHGIPNNLMPFLAQVAIGLRPCLSIFGHDYFTRDGTGVRDYIHVMDLARGHVVALERMDDLVGSGSAEIFNLGTGNGSTVLEMVHSFEKAAGRSIPYELAERRQGDVSELIADSDKARRILGWEAQFGIEDMCRDLWRWQSQNPNGYVNDGDLSAD